MQNPKRIVSILRLNCAGLLLIFGLCACGADSPEAIDNPAGVSGSTSASAPEQEIADDVADEHASAPPIVTYEAPEELGALPQQLSSPAPSCLEAEVTSGGGVNITNTCQDTRRFKVIYAFGDDSDCTSLDPGFRVHVFRGTPGSRFDGLENC